MDELIKESIEKYYLEDDIKIIVTNIKTLPHYYFIALKKWEFDGSGYGWYDHTNWAVSKNNINPYLRYEKIEKIKRQVGIR